MTAALRVTHLIGDLKAGGAQRQLLNLLAGLPPDEVRCGVITWRDGPHDHALRAEVPEHVATWHLPRRSAGDVTWAGRVTSVLRQTRPDILHGWLSSASAWAVTLGRAARVPRIVTSELTLREPRVRLAVHHLGNAAVADSQAGLARLPRRTRVYIPPGVRARVDGAVAEIAGRVVLCLGSLTPDKNQEVLVEHARRTDDQVVLVGPALDEEYAAALRRDAPPNVHFVGTVDDPGPWLRRADVLALPSRTESCPNAVIEALVYGVPVVATAVGDVPRLLEHGRRGVVVPPGDALAFSRALAHPVPPGDPARVLRQYSVERQIERYRALYDRLRP